MLSRTFLGALLVMAAGLTAAGCSPASHSSGTIVGVVVARRLVGGAGVTFKNTWQYVPIQVRVEALEHGQAADTVVTSKGGSFHAKVNAGHYAVRIVSYSRVYDRCVSKPASITVRKKSTVRIKGYCYETVFPG
jgi:hypothetical protein